MEKQNVPVTTGKKDTSIHPLIEMEKAFDRFFGRGWALPWHVRDFPALDNLLDFEGARMPKLDIIDREKEVLVRAEIPGLKKKDIDVSVNNNILVIKGQTTSEKKEEKGEYHRHEISSSSYARSVTLPATVDASKTVATLNDGVLEVTLPKTQASTKRSIPVQ